jgi:hypothetical protein
MSHIMSHTRGAEWLLWGTFAEIGRKQKSPKNREICDILGFLVARPGGLEPPTF